MTSSISWIDQAGLAETLARIGSRGRARPSRVPARSPVRLAILEAPGETDNHLPPFEAPTGPLRDRLDAFMTWLSDSSGSNVSFIVDRDGLPLVDRGADPDLLAIASSVIRLIERINSKLLSVVGQAVTIQLEGGQLVLISVKTPIGDYTIGHVGDRPPNPELQEAAAEALQRAFQSSGETSSSAAS